MTSLAQQLLLRPAMTWTLIEAKSSDAAARSMFCTYTAPRWTHSQQALSAMSSGASSTSVAPPAGTPAGGAFSPAGSLAGAAGYTSAGASSTSVAPPAGILAGDAFAPGGSLASWPLSVASLNLGFQTSQLLKCQAGL